ncbi:hypothetical protein [Alloprevotella tannerae]|nr:hypothetical protein [Alloprevotella tannerae]
MRPTNIAAIAHQHYFRLVGANDDLPAANNGLAAANDSLVGANNERRG